MIGLQGRRGQGGRAECSKEQMSGMSFLINHKHDFPRVKLEIVLKHPVSRKYTKPDNVKATFRNITQKTMLEPILLNYAD